MERSDAELVQAAIQGDQASFGQLYERHYRLAVAIARARLTDLHLAEDTAQEAFAVACRTLSTLKNPERFPEWLGTICRRTASRMSDRRPGHEPLEDDQGPGTDPEAAALRMQVQEALQQLDEVTREIVVLRYFGSLSYEEIAMASGLTVPGVHGRLQRARVKLAQLLDEQLDQQAAPKRRP